MIENPSLRYLVGFTVSFMIVIGAIWLYIITFPQGFLESGYAVWTAKQEFLSQCDLGKVLISGDSRVEAAVDPRKLDVSARIVAFGGETPIENYIFLRRAMQCKTAPQSIVIALTKQDFSMAPPYLWENGARFGYIGYAELDNVLMSARQLGDPVIDNSPSRLGINGKLRNLLYAIRFPPLYFNALISGQIWRRASLNQDRLSETSAALGHVDYVAHDKNAQVLERQDILPDAFVPSPTQNAFFERTLSLLEERNIPVLFISMPVPADPATPADDVANNQFLMYLLGFAKRHQNFHVVTPLTITWPAAAFVDGTHMDSFYVATFTARFQACLHRAKMQEGPVISCDLSWAIGAPG
jgi:hypothetical protein